MTFILPEVSPRGLYPAISHRLFGCYEALKSGMSNNAMEDLTGGVGEHIDIPKKLNNNELQYRKRILFNELHQTFRQHSLINASISTVTDHL